MSDLTDLRDLRKVWKATNRALQMACHDNRIVTFSCEPVDPYVAHWFSNNIFEELGVTKNEYTEGRWKDLVHPEDTEIALNGDPTGFLRYRMFNPHTNTYFWLESRAAVIYDDSNIPLALVGWLRNAGKAHD